MKNKTTLIFNIFIGALTFSAFASESITYTPTQLQEMVSNNNYPQQGAVSTKSLDVDFTTCIAKIDSIIESVSSNYPTKTIVATNAMRIEKIWTNDSAMVLTCSSADQKLIITTAPYL